MGTRSALGLLRACHFPPTVVVTAIGGALAVSIGRGWGVLAVVAAIAAGQLTVGWSNDYIDRDRDRETDRRDKPIVTGAVHERTVRIAAVVAATACVPLSFLSGWRAALAHLVAVAAALAYNARLKATVASALPYIAAFALLPAFVTLGSSGHPWPPWWATGAAALLGCGAHFVNTLADIDDDRRLGVNGLPHRLGATRALVIGAVLLAVAIGLETVGPSGRLHPVAVAMAFVALGLVVAVVVCMMAGRAQLAWPLTLAVAVVAVGLLVANGASLT